MIEQNDWEIALPFSDENPVKQNAKYGYLDKKYCYKGNGQSKQLKLKITTTIESSPLTVCSNGCPFGKCPSNQHRLDEEGFVKFTLDGESIHVIPQQDVFFLNNTKY